MYGTAENPLFKAKDVADWIEHSDVSTMMRSVDDDEKLSATNPNNACGGQSAWFLTEDGLYEVLMLSRKPIAKQFKKGVKEILKSIRKTGGYMTIKDNESEEDLMARALLVAQQTIRRREERIKSLENNEKENAPKVAFANAIISSKKNCLVGELAKVITQNGYKIGQNRLFEWMRLNGYLGKHGEYYNIPNQKYVEQGLFELKKGVRSGNDGVIVNTITTTITPKGQQYFILKFIDDDNKPDYETTACQFHR